MQPTSPVRRRKLSTPCVQIPCIVAVTMTSCQQWCTERGRHSMRPSRRLLIWLKTPGERGGAENLAVERLRGARAARVAKDPAFAAALLPRKTSRAAGIHTMLAGDSDTG